MKRLNFSLNSIHAITCIVCIALCTVIASATTTKSSVPTTNNGDMKSRIEVTASGDTIIQYYYDPIDFGTLFSSVGEPENKISSNKLHRSVANPQTANTNIAVSTINTGKHVGKIPFSEGVTPTGGKTISVPILSAKVPGDAPQIALVYNSQGGNSVAGFGWEISGLSAITLTNKNHYYDGKVEASDLSKPDQCVFALNGTRLVTANETNIPEYKYVTAQGFIYVKKILSGNNIAYFEALYPDGSKATFGFKSNTSMQLCYPLTSIVDLKGYRTDFEYTASGNNYYIKNIKYGSKSSSHPAEISFEYESRTDFTTVYAYGQALKSSKLLKKIVSKVDSQELRTYTFSHNLTNNVNQLIKIDCSVGTSHLNPLTFAYNYYEGESEGVWDEVSSAYVSEYFKNTPENRIQYVRGKLLKDTHGDGMIIFPGKFSTYAPVRVYKVLDVPKAWEYGSQYPANQEILIIPNVRFFNNPISILAESGFQSINAIDINGDGVDEVVKINFNGLEGSKTILKITVYSFSSYNSYQTRTHNVKVEGCINSNNRLYSPISRSYYWGNFNGDGKTQLLTVSHNKTFSGESRDSYFALIDISVGKTLSEYTLFPHSTYEESYTHAMDIDGDGKSELGHAETNQYQIYKLSNNTFIQDKTYPNLSKTKLTQPHKIADLNGDGKIDFVFPPYESYQNIQMVNIPVWAPQFCPVCHNEFPIVAVTDETCRHCSYFIGSPYEHADVQVNDLCFECHSQLVSANPNSESAGRENKFWCNFHGYSVPKVIDFGWVDSGNEWTVYLNTGTGFTETRQNISTREQGDKFTFIDVNKDGLTDMIRVHKSEAELYLNKNGMLASSPCGDTIVLEEGLSDFIPINISNPLIDGSVISVKDNMIYAYDFTRNVSKANLLTSITDSHGITYSTEYMDMTETGIYTKSATSRNYPYINVSFPLNLVFNSRVTMPGSDKYLSNIYYKYQGAVAHLQGLGFCGFEKTETYDAINDMRTQEIRDILMHGVTTKITSPLKEISHSYSHSKRSNGQENIRLLSSTELNKLTQVSTNTNYQYDLYGNPTRITHTAGSDKQKEITQTYKNILSSDKFIVGLPLVKTVTHSCTYYNDLDVNEEIADDSSSLPADETTGIDILLGNRRRTSMEIIPPVEIDSIVPITSVTETWIEKEEITYGTNFYLPIVKKSYTGTNGDKKIQETRWEYDSNGNVVSEKSAPFDLTEFQGTTHTYDATGRNLLSSTDAMGKTVSYSDFDKYGNVKKITDYKGRVSTIAYDEWGVQSSSTSPDGLTEAISTAWGGKGVYTVTKTSTGKPATIVHYDAADREVRKGNLRFDGTWQYVDNSYDSKGRLEKVSLPFKGDEPTYWNSYSYDSYNRPVQITEASGKISTWSYNGLSETETKNGITSTKTYDESGSLISVTDQGGVIKYNLRPDGQCKSITAPGGVTTEFEYDEYGRKTEINDPSAGRQTYAESYDTDGSKTNSVTDANGKTISTKTDKYGRVISTIRPEFNTAYTYDSDGLLTKEASTNGTSVEYTYDSYDRPLTVKETGLNGVWLKKTFSYTDGNIESIKYENQQEVIGTEKYIYANGHNTEIIFNDNIPIWKLTAENNLGQPTESATGVLTRSYSYTEFGVPTKRKAGSIQDFSYDFDTATGNLNSRTDNTRGLTENFTYDLLNRLVAFGNNNIEYAENGNIMAMPGVGLLNYETVNRPYQVSTLIPEGGAVPLRDQNVTYTSFKRHSSILEDDIKASFAYNAAGDRVKMLVEKDNQTLLSRHYIGNQYECDVMESPLSDSGEDTHRLYLGGDAYSAPVVYVKNGDAWQLYYICRDYLGSITHIANADGSLKAEYSYDAWGRLRDPETQEVYEPGTEPILFLGRGYTGHEHLPWFGLINMNARLYDPTIGRFLSPDPYVQAPDFTQNLNRYSYCLNNPFSYTDQNGEWIQIVIGAVIGGVANWWTNGHSFSWSGLAYFGVGAAVGALSSVGGAWIASTFKAVGVVAGAGVGAVSGAVTGGASSILLNGGNNLLNGRNFTDNWKKNLISGMIGGALSGGITGGYKGYKYAEKLGANPWNRNKIGSTRRFKTIAKPDIKGQADPTKHCYAVAGEYADAGHGNRSRTDFLNAAAKTANGSIPDGADFSKVAVKLDLQIENLEINVDNFNSLGDLMNQGNGEGVLSIGTDRLHAHIVNVVSFDIVEKFNHFGGGFQSKVENLKIWDPIGAQLRYFSENILKLTQIKY